MKKISARLLMLAIIVIMVCTCTAAADSTTYTYDDYNRLTSVVMIGSSLTKITTFIYDDNGNLLFKLVKTIKIKAPDAKEAIEIRVNN